MGTGGAEEPCGLKGIPRERKRAEDELSTIEKYWAGKDIRNLLDIGEANSLECQGNKAAAQKAFENVRKRISAKDARALLCQQFSGCRD